MFESQDQERWTLETRLRETDVGGTEPIRSWEIQFPSGRGDRLHLLLMDVLGTLRVVIVAYRHGGMAPESLRFFPPPESGSGPWSEESKLRDTEDSLMSIRWSADHETIETGVGSFDTRHAELWFLHEEEWLPLLGLWLARGEGIVQFECNGVTWTLEE